MAAIVRVKRCISDEPLENIVVSCKRIRLSENVDTPVDETVTTELKFAGTVVDKADTVSQHIRKAIKKEKLENEYKRHAYRDHTTKSRTICQTSSKNKRYLVVSQCRSEELDKIDSVLDGDGSTLEKTADASKESATDSVSDKIYCLYDIELDVDPIAVDPQNKDVVTCNSVPMEREKVTVEALDKENREYVYDLYYINHYGFDYRWLESTSSIELYEKGQVFMDERLTDSDDNCEDDSDSNDENNWRNDYPDEDPHIYDHKECSDEEEEVATYENFGLGSDDEELENMLAHRIEKCFLDEEDEEEDEREYYKHQANISYSLAKAHEVGKRSYEQYKEAIEKELNNT